MWGGGVTVGLWKTSIAWLCASFILFLTAAQAQTQLSKSQRIQEVKDHLSHYSSIKNAPNQQMTLASRMAELHVPGVSIAVIKNGRIDWARGYGVSSLGGPPVTRQTLFGTASISKPFTAMGVLKLVEEGKIDLDVDVNRYLKRWKIPENQFTAQKKVTVRELLSHTSGIGTHNDEIYDPSKPLPTIIQVLNGEKPAKTVPVRVEAVPGSKFAYSNGGYMVLYLLVEDVSGEPFAKFMEQNVLKPIGMNHSTFDGPLPHELADRAATAYAENGTTPVPPSKFYEPNLAAGGLWSTPSDLAKFLIELQREYAGTSHRVLDQAMARLMMTPVTGPPAMRVGLGIQVGGSPQNPFVRHEGSAFFQDEMVAYLHGDGIVVMTSGGDGGQLTGDVVRSAATVYDMPDFKSVEHTITDVPAQVLSSYAGTYVFVKVSMQGDHLMAEIPIGSHPQRLYPASQTRFFVLDGPQELSFDRDQQGDVTGVEFSTTITHVALKKSGSPK
jgi:CubicO group peptidase (beta-lactamase class C family)